MQIQIAAVGKIKEHYLKDAIEEYSKRLSRYCSLEITEVSDEKAAENLSPAEEEAVREREGERLLKQIRDDAYVITLDLQGKQLSSEQLAAQMEDLVLRGESRITFVIGGSLGLGKNVKKRSDYALSFSKMTFPHQLMRVILLEQVYRSFKIRKGEPYHK